MKMTQFAFGCIILLLCAGMFLLLKSEMDDRHLQMVEEMKKMRADPAPQAPSGAQPPVPAAPAGIAAAVPPPVVPDQPVSVKTAAANEIAAAAAEADLKRREEELLAQAEARRQAAAAEAARKRNPIALPEEVPPEKLSPLQSDIRRRPAIARISDARDEQGFVVLDRGTEVGLQTGQPYSIRRGNIVIGRLEIGNTVESKECVADVIEIVPGLSLKPGDEVIDWTPPRPGVRVSPLATVGDGTEDVLVSPDAVVREPQIPPSEGAPPHPPGTHGSLLPAEQPPPLPVKEEEIR